jgi:hypothetical protein
LRVLTYRWHVPHQYELWKLPLDVTMVTGTGSAISDHWDYGQRPLPTNARFLALDDVNPRDYDLAILHFDENVLAPENSRGTVGKEWGAAFKLFSEQLDLPKVAICHGTPQFHGQYNIDYTGADLMQPIEAERRRLVDYLGDVHVVCNSYQAQAEWQFRRSSVIWHGFDPAEFPPADRTRAHQLIRWRSLFPQLYMMRTDVYLFTPQGVLFFIFSLLWPERTRKSEDSSKWCSQRDAPKEVAGAIAER